MTLRQALTQIDRSKLYSYILHTKHTDDDAPPIEQISNNYGHVIDELLSLKKNKPYEFDWHLRYEKDWFDKKKYINVNFINHQYVKPARGLKPWGATAKNKKVPTGYYDCNADKHNQFYGCGFENWNKIIDTPIINTIKKLSLEGMVAEILWELTFWGWTNKISQKKTKEIIGKLK